MDPHGLPAWRLAEACQVSLDTARRWKRQGRLPPPADRLADLVIGGELGALADPWRGFVLRQKIIWTPEGFSVTPGQVCAIPYRLAQIAALQQQLAEPQQWPLFR